MTTNAPAFTGSPSLSPDGSKIVFMSNRDSPGFFTDSSKFEIYVMNANGTGQTRLTNNESEVDFEPSWSPDGKRIVFSSISSGTSPQIYVMDANGANLQKVATSGGGMNAIFSPDGRKIVFDRYNGKNSDIFSIGVDGTGETQLTASGDHPSFSPDGTRIAFTSEVDIFVMNADGSNRRNITNSFSAEQAPSFSPDGSRIAFDNRESFSSISEIFSISVDGSNRVQLTTDPAKDSQPSWSTAPTAGTASLVR